MYYIFNAIGFNFVLIIAYIIAVILAKKGHPWIWMLIGLVFTLVSLTGLLMDNYNSTEVSIDIIIMIVLTAVFIPIILTRWLPAASERETAKKEMKELKNKYKNVRLAKCSECGTVFEEALGKCPNCNTDLNIDISQK